MKAIIVILLLPFGFMVNAQNLILNGNFEDTIACPQNPSWKFFLKHWIQRGGGGAYYNSCSSTYGVPQNGPSYQNAHSGAGYIIEYTFDSIYWQNGGTRTFAIGKLSQALVAGKKYHVGYYVSLADSVIIACNYMGMHFSDTVPTFNGLNTYPVPPLTASVEFHQDLTNKTDWTKLDTIYIANGTERFITIGNMRDNTQCHGIYVGGNDTCTVNYCWDYAMYLVDDVFVELLDETGLSPSSGLAKNGVGIVPNPNNGEFKLLRKVL